MSGDNFTFNSDKVGGTGGNTGPASQGDVKQPKAASVGASSFGMRSRFDTDTSEVSSKIIAAVNHTLTTKVIDGVAKPVSIRNSEKFKGVIVIVSLDGVNYSQAIVIDERPVQTISQLLDTSKTTGAILFGSALLSKDNAAYLSALDSEAVDTVKLETLIIISEEYRTDSAITNLVRDIFKRIEARPYTSVSESLNADRSKPIVGHFYVDGQHVALGLTHKEVSTSIDGLIVGDTSTILNVQARVEPILGAVVESVNGVNQNVAKLRPIVWLSGFDKPESFAKFNLEYGLVSIVSASLLAREDKVITALLPNAVHKTNIASLNSLFPTEADGAGQFKPLNFLDPKISGDLESKVSFIRRITTPAAIGIALNYRSDGSAYNTFGGLIDAGNTKKALQQAELELLAAYKNLTGKDYAGSVIERTIQAPSGVIITKQGEEKSLDTIDGIWLATNGFIDEARDWFLSDTTSDSFVKKMDIIKAILVKISKDIDVKIKCITSKIILDTGFVNALVENSGFKIESAYEDIPLGNTQQTFTGSLGAIGISHGVQTAGVTPFGGTQNNIRIIG